MSETTAPVAAPSTPVVETPPAAPPATAPERSLADFVADHVAAVQQRAGRAPAAATPPETPPVVEKPLAETPAAAKPPEEPAKPDDTPPAAKPPEDERARTLAEYVRGKRLNRDESMRLKAEADRLKSIEASAAEKEAAAAKVLALKARAATDPVGAVEELLGKDKFGNDFLLAALDRVTKGDTGKQLTEEERQAVIAEAAAQKVRAELKAEAEAAETKRVAEQAAANDAGKARYFGQVQAHLTANAEIYPMMSAEGWPTADMEKAVAEHHEATGQWPTADQVLTHFESLHVARAERLAAIKAKRDAAIASPAKPLSKSPAAALVKTPVDARGRGGKPIEEGSYEQRRAVIQARLDGKVAG